jgi:hypothetical protein
MLRTTMAAGILAALALVTGAGAGAASAASASPPPGTPLVSHTTAGWSSLTYRPGAIFVGNGGSPIVRRLAWGSWTTSAATTRAGQIVQFFCPGPSANCPGTTHPVTVFLHDVRVHRGQPYFAKMRWTWVNHNGRTRVAYWLYGLEGGTVPAWMVR